MTSLYEHAGGDEAIHRLEELFYDKVLADPILKTLFTERIPTHVDHLSWFTAESFGGPDRFTRRLGFQHIIDVHRHLKITDEQRERFVVLYKRKALAKDAASVRTTPASADSRFLRLSPPANSSTRRWRLAQAARFPEAT
jgi:truncated hemoglobin YjbI